MRPGFPEPSRNRTRSSPRTLTRRGLRGAGEGAATAAAEVGRSFNGQPVATKDLARWGARADPSQVFFFLIAKWHRSSRPSSVARWYPTRALFATALYSGRR